jgi:hypothetical protein
LSNASTSSAQDRAVSGATRLRASPVGKIGQCPGQTTRSRSEAVGPGSAPRGRVLRVLRWPVRGRLIRRFCELPDPSYPWIPSASWIRLTMGRRSTRRNTDTGPVHVPQRARACSCRCPVHR